MSNCNITVSNGYELAALGFQALASTAWPIAIVLVAWMIYRRNYQHEQWLYPTRRKGKE